MILRPGWNRYEKAPRGAGPVHRGRDRVRGSRGEFPRRIKIERLCETFLLCPAGAVLQDVFQILAREFANHFALAGYGVDQTAENLEFVAGHTYRFLVDLHSLSSLIALSCAKFWSWRIVSHPIIRCMSDSIACIRSSSWSYSSGWLGSCRRMCRLRIIFAARRMSAIAR